MKNKTLKLYPISYYGNKYAETKKYLFKTIDYSTYDVIAEPFGGIFGFSRAIYEICKDNTIFLINDIDSDLIKLHNFFKNNDVPIIKKTLSDFIELHKINVMTDKELCTFVKNYKNEICISYIYIKFSSQVGMHKVAHINKRINNNILNLEKYKDFFNRCTFYNMESKKFLEEIHKVYNNKKILIFFDPPYFDSSNKTYIQSGQNILKDNKIIVCDNTSIYIDILEAFKIYKHCILLINSCSILNYLYKDYIKNVYTKTYSLSIGRNFDRKRQTQHVLYSNIDTHIKEDIIFI